MQFIRSTLLQGHALATETLRLDLPVNPLSHIIVTLEGYNVTDEATLAQILQNINYIRIDQMGRTIFYAESEDIAALNCYLYHAHPVLTNCVATDNATRALALIVPFSRKPYDPDECFPATRKGELSITIDTTCTETHIDNQLLTIETVELPEASPSRYLKTTTRNVTAPSATGDNDVDLPIGNPILALLLAVTTFPTTSSHTYGVNAAKILVDNVEHLYASATAQGMIADWILFKDTLSRTAAAQGQLLPQNYLVMDFDPTRDGKYALQTAGKSSVKLRLTMGVAEATRVTTLELVQA